MTPDSPSDAATRPVLRTSAQRIQHRQAPGRRLPPAAAHTPVLVSEVVTFVAEYRLFLLDGTLATASRYAVHGRVSPAPLADDPYAPQVRAFAGR